MRNSRRPAAILEKINALLCPPLLKQCPKFLLHTFLHLVREHHRVFYEQLPILVSFVLFMQMAFMIGRHSLAWNGLYLQGLDHFSPLPAQLHDVPIEVCKISRPAAHPCFPQTQNLLPVEVSIFPSEKGPICSRWRLFTQLWLFL